jgi:hypothetical protein
MPTIQLNNFGGIIPRIHPTLLPQNCATKAHNCILKNGKLVPIKEPGVLENVEIYSFGSGKIDFESIKTMHLWHLGDTQKFVVFDTNVDCVPGNFYEDEQYKFFIAGETMVGENEKDICVVYKKDDEYKIMSMLKTPPPAPVATNENIHDYTEEELENIRYTFYFQSWVDELGFESEASGPSNEIEYLDGDSIKIGMWGSNVPTNAVKRRIYKVITGLELGGTPQFVAEQKKSGNVFDTFTIEDKDENAGEVMPSITNPHNKVDGICSAPGGYAIWCSCSPKTVRFSDGAPNNFPNEYAYEVEYEIVGLASIGNSVVVLTKGNPFIISGSSPDTMVVTKLSAMQACISKKTICVVDGAVYYVSKDGICMITEGQSSVIVVTSSYFSQREWRDIISDNLIMCGYDNILYLWNTKQGVGYSFNFIDKEAGITTFDENTNSVFVDPVEDKMFFIKDDNIVAWEDGTENKILIWRSKRIQTDKPLNFSSAQIYSDGYPVKLSIDMSSSPDKPTIDANHVDISVTTQKARRLPIRRPEKYIEIEVECDNEITDISISTSMEGLHGNM